MAGRELELGAFSVGLAVKDLAASKAFYEALGFSQTGGDGDHYLIMVNGAAIVGLFHGMFEAGSEQGASLRVHGRARHPRAAGRGGHRDDHRHGSGGHRARPRRVRGPGRQRRLDRSVLPAAGQRGSVARAVWSFSRSLQ